MPSLQTARPQPLTTHIPTRVPTDADPETVEPVGA